MICSLAAFLGLFGQQVTADNPDTPSGMEVLLVPPQKPFPQVHVSLLKANTAVLK